MNSKKTWLSPLMYDINGGDKILTGATYYPGPECFSDVFSIVTVDPAFDVAGAVGAACAASPGAASITLVTSVGYTVTSCLATVTACYDQAVYPSFDQVNATVPNSTANTACVVGTTGTGAVNFGTFACS